MWKLKGVCMAINPINALNPFQKAMSASQLNPVQLQQSVFPPQNGQSAVKPKQNPFGAEAANPNINIAGLNPFASVNKVQSPVESIAPVGAKENYFNGLAPLSDLQNVYNGTYKGKPNILNQIAIA